MRINMFQDKLKELVSYDENTGLFIRIKTGKFTGSKNSDGYVLIRLLGSKWLSHRLAWMYVNGSFPKNGIDHIDGDRSNNRISNLREANHSQNAQNERPKFKVNKHGFAGVTFFRGRFTARIKLNGVKIYLGIFGTPEEASLAYKRAKKEIHPFSTQ